MENLDIHPSLCYSPSRWMAMMTFSERLGGKYGGRHILSPNRQASTSIHLTNVTNTLRCIVLISLANNNGYGGGAGRRCRRETNNMLANNVTYFNM